MSWGLPGEESHSDVLNNLNAGIVIHKYIFAAHDKPGHLCYHGNASGLPRQLPQTMQSVALLYSNARWPLTWTELSERWEQVQRSLGFWKDGREKKRLTWKQRTDFKLSPTHCETARKSFNLSVSSSIKGGMLYSSVNYSKDCEKRHKGPSQKRCQVEHSHVLLLWLQSLAITEIIHF